MDFEVAMEHALRGDAILFTGAGFSLGAKNIKGQPLKTGWQLATYLATEAGIPEQTRLEDAAESFVEECGEDRLIDLLREEFTVLTVEAYHRVIASIPWKRIYTTNYDDVIEKASNQEGMAVTTVSLSDKSQNIPIANRICVHLNGCINRLDRETVSSEIKLTDVSYLTASIVESPWSAFFRQDLRLARAVFFVGYSLADLDIKRIIYDFEDLKTKCFFVLGIKPDNLAVRRANKFGVVLDLLDTDGFASNLLRKRQTYSLVEPLPLEHYCYDKVNVGDRGADFSDSSLIDLLALGDFQQEFVRRSIYEDLPYFCERKETSRVVDFLKGTGRAIVVHSDLGNGKTLFVEGIHYRAVEQGFDVYELHRRSEDIYRETEQIIHSETPHMIIIENYHDWFDVLDLISMHWNHKTKLVLTARSSIHDVTIDGLLRSLEISSIPEFSLDNLDDRDVAWLVNLFDLYGLWGDKAAWSVQRKTNFINRECRSQFHAVLLSIITAPQILTRLNEIASTLSKERKYYKIASSILIYTVLGRAMTLSLLAELWGSIVYESRFRRDEALRQLISFDRDRVRMRSSVAAEYILKDIVDPNLTVDVLIEMVRTADKLAPIDRVYADLRTELMRFRNLNILLPEQGRRATIIRYYESIKALRGSGRHPLFWLQYAIACVTIDEYDRAETYFQTSYALGQARNNWDSYQTNNHYARFLLKKAIFSRDASNCMASFRKARAIINSQIATERRHFPYRVAILYADFFTAFAASLGDKERREISLAATHVLNRINQLPEDVLKNRYVRECRETLSILVMMEQTGSELDSDSN